VAEFKTTFSANFSTFLWETHNELRKIRQVYLHFVPTWGLE